MASGGPAVTSVAVVGAGYMGTGIAQLVALAGLPCALADADAARAEQGRRRAVADAERLERDGLLPAGVGRAARERVLAAADVADAVADADLVVEAVSEDPAVKAAVLSAVEAAAPAGAIVATNTSAIPIAELAAGLKHPERFVGAHWFNPPQLVPCVELIAGPQTTDEVAERCAAFLRRLGKEPVRVGDGPGFVANRIQFAMFREAVAVVADGVATAEEVDAVVRSSFGYRLPFMGPFAIADMAGLDVYTGAYAALERGLGDHMSAPPALLDHVRAGRLGTKSGGGFLPLSDAEAAALRDRRDRGYAALGGLLRDLDAGEPA